MKDVGGRRTTIGSSFDMIKQLTPNDADVVWEDMIDDETKKPARTKDG